MATVFMKFLELWPRDYERGIRWLTLGRIEELRRRIAEEWVEPGDRVLDVGCGAGEQALLCAHRGARVIGIDASEPMLEVARGRAAAKGLAEQAEFLWLDASEIGERFPAGSFDVIICSLVLSELDQRAQRRLLAACQTLLREGGRLLIVEEVEPEGRLARWAYHAWRWPWAALTWFLIRSTTYPLRRPERLLAEAGFRAVPVASHLGGSLRLLLGQKGAWEEAGEAVVDVPELKHRVTVGTLLRDFYCLLMRIVPPYLGVRPGLYRIGRPGRNAPVLVTGNFDLTVRRLLKSIRGLDAYLLVADSRAINVWCAAGGGHFTAEKVIAAVRRSGLEGLVGHRRLILPQLCANGVEGRRIEEATGWRVRWGPVRAADIPAYLARGGHKSEAMRWVTFPWLTRLEMGVVMWSFWALLLAVVLLIVQRSLVVPALLSSLGMFLVVGAFWPWLPGHQGIAKGSFLAVLTVLWLVVWSLTVGHWPLQRLFNWGIGLSALALFAGADYQGADPRRRAGEAEQFPRLVPLELGLGVAYLVVPRLLGW